MIRILARLLAFALILSACSTQPSVTEGDKSGENGRVASPLGATATPTLAPVLPPAPRREETESYHAVLTMPWDDPITLDPAISRETRSHLFVGSIFSGLVRFDHELRLQPDLAEMIEVDETGTVYTFTIRQGAQFHDGRRIAAYDVKYSIDRATDPTLMSATAPLYLGDIVGVRERLRGLAAHVDGVQVLDARTLSITIDKPKAFFLAKMTYPSAAVVDRQTIEGAGVDWWKGKINGSGPFKLREWIPGERLVLERSTDYHAPSSLESVIFPIRQGVPMEMYATGAIDVAMIGGSSIDRALDPSNNLADQLVVFPQFNTHYVGFNAREAPFDDRKARRAFAMAVDRRAMVDTLYEGDVDFAKGLLPPGMPGYSRSLPAIPFDPERARELLSQSKYAKQFPKVVYTAPGTSGVPARVDFLVRSWQEVLGVEVDVELLSPEAYFYQLDERVGNMFDYGWVADYPDPENFLDLLLHSDHDTNNVGGYDNLKYDRLLELARVEPDLATRMRQYRDAERLLLQDAGIIPLFHSPDYALVKPNVIDFVIGPLGLPDLSRVSIEP